MNIRLELEKGYTKIVDACNSETDIAKQVYLRGVVDGIKWYETITTGECNPKRITEEIIDPSLRRDLPDKSDTVVTDSGIIIKE